MGIEPHPRVLALLSIARRIQNVQDLRLRAREKELVDETAADGEAETAVRWTYLSAIALLPALQTGQDLPISAGDQDCESLLVGDFIEALRGSVHGWLIFL